MGRLRDIIDLNVIINLAIHSMNTNDEYTEVIFKEGKSGTIQKLTEIKIVKAANKLYPDLEFYHPEDNTGLPDLYSKKLNQGIEIKTTLGWYAYGERQQVAWSNGTIQSKSENFLFIDLELINDKTYLQVNNAYYGENISYNEWSIHYAGYDDFGYRKTTGMFIGQRKVKQLCENFM